MKFYERIHLLPTQTYLLCILVLKYNALISFTANADLPSITRDFMLSWSESILSDRR
jgi:hypothetical protein